MLFNTDDLNTDYNTRNTLNLLESMYRIDRVWAKHTPASVPLMESKEYGAFIARYSDLMKLSEEYDASIQECLDAVIYENHLRPNEVIVSLEEWRPYVDPLILHRFSNNYVLVPEINTPAYRLCEICMESFLETGDYTWLDFYVEADESVAKHYMEKVMRQQADYNALLAQAKQMKQNSKEYKIAQQRLLGLEKAIAKNKQLAGVATTTLGKDSAERSKLLSDTDEGNQAVLAKTSNILTAQEKKEQIKKNQERLQQTPIEITAPSAKPKVSQKDDEPGWFAQKWTALKNWWNNAGQADSNGNVGFFSNLAAKFKNLIGWGNNNQNNNTTNTNQVNNQAAQAAQKVENEKKQAEKTEQQQAEKAAEQVKNDKKQEENKTAPATAPATPTDNKPAAPAATS